MSRPKSNEMDLTVGNPFWSLLKFAVPVILGNLFQLFYTLADSVIVGKTLGADSLAAVGATSIIIYFVFCFINGFTGGFGICLGQRCGAKDEKGMRKSVAASTLLSIIFTIVLTLICCLLAHQILRWMQIPDDISGEAYDYMFVVLLGTGATVFYNMISNMLRALGDSKTPLYFLVFSSVLNIFLDILFIVPFHMGVAGAAWATILSQFLSALFGLIVGLKNFPVLHLRREDFHGLGGMIGLHLKTGFPMGFQMSVMCIGQLAMQTVVNSLGTAAVAGYTAASKADQVSVLVNNAMMTSGCAGLSDPDRNAQSYYVRRHSAPASSDRADVPVRSYEGNLSLFRYVSDCCCTVLFYPRASCCLPDFHPEYAEWAGSFCCLYDRTGHAYRRYRWSLRHDRIHFCLHRQSSRMDRSLLPADSGLLQDDAQSLTVYFSAAFSAYSVVTRSSYATRSFSSPASSRMSSRSSKLSFSKIRLDFQVS